MRWISTELCSTLLRRLEQGLTGTGIIVYLQAITYAAGRRIMSTNEYLLRSMRTSTERSHSSLDAHPCQFGSSSHTSSACLLSSPDTRLSEAYVRALSTYEAVLHDLIQYNTATLMKATVFDEDLIVTMRMTAQERLEAAVPKGGLGFLWALLGGRNHALAHLTRNEDILNNVGLYSMRSLRYVQGIHDALEAMQRHLEELRAVASGALVSEGVAPEVVLEMLARGMERLGRARSGYTRVPALIGQ